MLLILAGGRTRRDCPVPVVTGRVSSCHEADDFSTALGT